MSEINSVESIGERLHKARLKKKVTIDEVYKDTKIHPKVLIALEEDRYDEFLSSTYIKAFIKSYCRYLDLDANKILDDYDKLRGKETIKPVLELEEAKQPFVIQTDWQKYIIKFGKKWALPIIAGIAGVFLAISLIILTSKAVGKIKNAIAARPKIKITETQPEPSIKKPLTIPQGQPLNLIIKTKGDVWLEVKTDEKTVFKSVLKKGNVEAYKADEKIQLWTGKGEFVDLVLNGNPLGSPGNGVIKNILLTREGLRVDKK